MTFDHFAVMEVICKPFDSDRSARRRRSEMYVACPRQGRPPSEKNKSLEVLDGWQDPQGLVSSICTHSGFRPGHIRETSEKRGAIAEKDLEERETKSTVFAPAEALELVALRPCFFCDHFEFLKRLVKAFDRPSAFCGQINVAYAHIPAYHRLALYRLACFIARIPRTNKRVTRNAPRTLTNYALRSCCRDFPARFELPSHSDTRRLIAKFLESVRSRLLVFALAEKP